MFGNDVLLRAHATEGAILLKVKDKIAQNFPFVQTVTKLNTATNLHR